MLQAARAIGKMFEGRLDVVTTYLGAHATPQEYKGNPDGYIDDIVCKQIPLLKADGLLDMVDVFCDSIAFTQDQASRVLHAYPYL